MKSIDALSLCTFDVAGETYGVESRSVRRVLGESQMQPVPLAPAFVAGAIAYRGEVLVVLCSRNIFGLRAHDEPRTVVVVSDDAQGEVFGLAVDHVREVIEVDATNEEANPCTLDAVRAELHAGSFRAERSMVVRLDPQKLRPSAIHALLAERNGGRPCAR